MKQLTLFILVGILTTGLSEGLEHSALSDPFVLDTRTVESRGLEHSALSNTFVLDTRDEIPALGLAHDEISNLFALDTRQESDAQLVRLEPDPNPTEPVVMSGGVGYLYYQLVDGNRAPIPGMAVAYDTHGQQQISPLSNEDGIAVLPVDTTGLPSSGTLDVAVTQVGPVTLEVPVISQLKIAPRSYEHTWEVGSAVSAKVGVAVGASGYVKGRAEAGIAYTLDESDVLTTTRTAELGVGVGVGAKTPGAKLTLGAVQAKAIAEATAEVIPYASFSDEYQFDNRHQREQQMAQSALLLDTAMRISGQPAPLALHLVDALVGAVGADYGTHRTMESVALGIHYQAGASAGVGVLGGFSKDGRTGPTVGVALGAEAALALALEAEQIRYYAGNELSATGYALHQELEASLDLGAAFGVGSIPDKDTVGTGEVGYTTGYISAKAGASLGESGFAGVFAQFGIANLWEFREEYIVKPDGQADSFLFSMGDRKETITCIIQGEDIARIQQSVANLVAFINISGASQESEVKVGMDAIVDELRSLLEQFVSLDVSYVVTEGRASSFELPIELEGNLGLDVGVGFRLDASERLDRTTLEGVFIGGHFYPLASYADEVSSRAQLSSIVDDALQGSWEIVKESFQQVSEAVRAETEAFIESAAVAIEQGVEVVKGTAELTATFTHDVGVTLITWFRPPDESVSAAPTGKATKYQQSLAFANAPVVGGYYQFTPEGEPLAEPGELTLSYTEEEVQQLGVQEESFRISYWDPDASHWVNVGGTVDSDSNRVTTTVTALHLYAITFDATPPGVGQLRPAPDAIITDPQMPIEARVVDDTNQLDPSSLVLLLDDTEVPYLFDGELVRYVPLELSPGEHAVTLRVSDLYGNATEETWSFTLRDSSATPWDVNGDGVVDILDLVAIGTAFGTTGDSLPADVNRDGTVDILDMVTIATHFGERTDESVSAAPQLPNHQHAELLESWLAQARAADDGSLFFRRGIALLERLLSSIVPEKTALLPNYPNPFNPETWFPYELSEGAEVTLTIYDALGRVIRQLEIGYQSAGIYRSRDRAAYWDGRNAEGESIASGAYFVVLKTQGFRQIRAIVLLK